MTATEPVRRAFGSWPSPLTAAEAAASGSRLAGPIGVDGVAHWIEGRPAEGGRYALVADAPGGPRDVTPDDWNIRSRVHEYGGGAAWAGPDGSVDVVRWDTQAVYRLDASGHRRITPEPPEGEAWRFADGSVGPDGRLAVVREVHDDRDEPANEIVLLHGDALEVVDASADFVAAPRFSPDGNRLSWFRWNHPAMPWDATEVVVRDLSTGVDTIVAGTPGVAAIGPDWLPDGRLVWSDDRDGHWDLWHWTPDAGAAPLVAVGADIGYPPWQFDLRSWCPLGDDAVLLVVTNGACSALHRWTLDGAESPVRLDDDLVDVSSVCALGDGSAAVVGATPTTPPGVYRVDPDGTVSAVQVAPAALPDGWISRATAVTFESDGRETQAWFHPPTAEGFAGLEGELPPLVVMGHGGPTSHAAPAYATKVQFWTSRGFAVADVNYGGSSGFGRAYRDRLDGRWGEVDVEDCIAAARHLAREGLVDGDRLVIRGGSAGGLTTLGALCRSDAFAAGTSLYGVVDLSALAVDTHKFESRYCDGLVGPWPEAAEVYRERSPIHQLDGLRTPVLVLQGDEDEIVPPNQAEAIVARLAEAGIPHAYRLFEGEQHGFRQAANIVAALESELWFYGRVLGFEPADDLDPVPGAVGLD